MDVLFKTIHGSRLYGLAKSDSDYDYFTVVDKVKNRRAKYSRQTIVDGIDTNLVDFGTFTDGCAKGVPQYLEAAFSTMAEIDEISEWRNSLYVGTGAWDRYMRTIKSFALSEKDQYKRKRHALRLALNFKDMRRTGRFNPTLRQGKIGYISILAEKPAEEVYKDALAIAWS